MTTLTYPNAQAALDDLHKIEDTLLRIDAYQSDFPVELVNVTRQLLIQLARPGNLDTATRAVCDVLADTIAAWPGQPFGTTSQEVTTTLTAALHQTESSPPTPYQHEDTTNERQP